MTAPRWLTLLFLLLAAPARADEPGASPVVEEPGLGEQPRVEARATGWLSARQRGPRFEVSYRTFDMAEMGDRRARYHLFSAHAYFVSRWLRAGTNLEGGFDDTSRGNFVVTNGFNLGAQWPARIAPFLDAVFALGVLRFEVLDDSLVCFTWQAGLEAGLSFYVHPKVFLSTALGWRRFVYRQPGNDQVAPVYVYNDSLSVRVGLGF